MLDFNVTQAYDTSSPQLVASEPIDYYMHIRYKPHERVALSMLKEIARLVRPIMVRHKYKLESLSEFLPDDRESLLGTCVQKPPHPLPRSKLTYPLDITTAQGNTAAIETARTASTCGSVSSTITRSSWRWKTACT